MSSPKDTKSTSEQESGFKPDIDDTTTSRRPWRRDPKGVSHLGHDGVLRSLDADRTAVLDVRRLSPDEIKEFATPFDQATKDALVGVDGRDVTDEAQLWAVPIVNSVADESKIRRPVVSNDQKSVSKDSPKSTPAKRA